MLGRWPSRKDAEQRRPLPPAALQTGGRNAPAARHRRTPATAHTPGQLAHGALALGTGSSPGVCGGCATRASQTERGLPVLGAAAAPEDWRSLCTFLPMLFQRARSSFPGLAASWPESVHGTRRRLRLSRRQRLVRGTPRSPRRARPRAPSLLRVTGDNQPRDSRRLKERVDFLAAGLQQPEVKPCGSRKKRWGAEKERK